VGSLSAEILTKLLYSLGTVVLVLVARILVLRYMGRRVEDHDAAYRARKILNYVATTLVLVLLAIIWIDAFQNLPTFLGLLSAGIAIALSDVLKNMAGWFFILTRRPFQVGDRVEVNELIGDVVDVRLFRFSLMEVGGWVDAEQSTGRLVHVPNGVVFTQPVANYTEGFPFIWDELAVLFTFESDWKLAEQLMRDILHIEAPDLEGAAGARIRETARRYSIRVGTLTPIVYVSVRDSGVLLTARYLVETRTRRGRADRIWRAMLDAFAENPTVELAYPTVRTYLPDVLRLDRS
jgi:small-conductance mechanosensitive channel